MILGWESDRMNGAGWFLIGKKSTRRTRSDCLSGVRLEETIGRVNGRIAGIAALSWITGRDYLKVRYNWGIWGCTVERRLTIVDNGRESTYFRNGNCLTRIQQLCSQKAIQGEGQVRRRERTRSSLLLLFHNPGTKEPRYYYWGFLLLFEPAPLPLLLLLLPLSSDPINSPAASHTRRRRRLY